MPINHVLYYYWFIYVLYYCEVLYHIYLAIFSKSVMHIIIIRNTLPCHALCSKPVNNHGGWKLNPVKLTLQVLRMFVLWSTSLESVAQNTDQLLLADQSITKGRCFIQSRSIFLSIFPLLCFLF